MSVTDVQTLTTSGDDVLVPLATTRPRQPTRLGVGSGSRVAAVVAVLVLLPGPLNSHWTLVATTTLVYGIVLLGFVVLYGWLGQLSFCQAELMGIGAFAAAALTEHHGAPCWVAALMSMAATVPVSMVVAIPGLRLRGFNLSLATLGYAVALDDFILNTQTVSRLDTGRPAGRPGWAGHPMGDTGFYFLALAVLLGAMALVVLVHRSNLGRSFRAVRDSEAAAEASGLAVWKYKLAGWALSSALAGLGGALLAFLLGTVNYRPFTVLQSLFLFAVAVIGGIWSVTGALVGAGFFVAVPELLSYVETTGKYTYLVNGLGVIVALLFFPGGLSSLPSRLTALVRRLRPQPDASEVG